MDPERLKQLLDRHFDQALSEEERRELEQILLESSAARDLFWETARLHAAVRQWGQEEWGRRDRARLKPQLSPRFARTVPVPFPVVMPKRRRLWRPLAAAVLICAGAVSWFYFFRPELEPPVASIAVLTKASEVSWLAPAVPPQTGSPLNPGWLRIRSGELLVEFSRGTRVVIEGPAEFEIRSENEGFLRFGKIFAHVPETARGFKVTASGLKVVDYGTAFGCLVPPEGAPEVHVFSGKVGVSQNEASELNLKASEAVRLTQGQMQPIPANSSMFIDEEKLAKIELANTQGQLRRWRDFSAEFRGRGDLLAYLDFQPDADWVRSLPNRAAHLPNGAGSEAAIVGCGWGQGRWPGKRGLEFKHPNDRVRLALPESAQTLSFLAWIRVDAMPNNFNGLVMGEDNQKIGQVQWYVHSNGSLGIGVRIDRRGRARQWWHSHSRQLFEKHEGTGKWTMVATVFDRAHSTVSHYANGELVGSDPVSLQPALQMGIIEIGNWGTQYPTADSGAFRGGIDELAVLSSALSAREIRRIYEAGRPGE